MANQEKEVNIKTGGSELTAFIEGACLHLLVQLPPWKLDIGD
jgi:hypothetical protein